ncbi:MAG TPA: copper homeostasis protein CutC [Longimicrobiales bacterium]
MILVELAVESLAAAQVAAAGGAHRIELAPDLALGGLTPSDELTCNVLAGIDIPVFVMVRPRGGDFVYSDRELADMCETIERLRVLGAHGVVSGALTKSYEIDIEATTALVSAAAGLPFTFHRAFDRAVDQSSALEQLIDLGVTRVLTSGGAATALDGSAKLRALVKQSAGRIAILAGGGVRESNVAEVVSSTGVSEVHTKLIDTTAEELTVAHVQAFCAMLLTRSTL